MSPHTLPSPTRFPGLPDRLLEQYLCGELPTPEAQRVERAAGESPQLAAYLEQRRREQAAFAAQRPFGALAARLPAAAPRPVRSWLRRFALPALLTPALSAAALLLVLRPAERAAPGDVRVRGGVKAGLVVKRGQSVFAHAPGVALRPGDQVRLQVEDARGGHLAVLLLSDRGAVQGLYGLADAGGALRMAPGALTLPDSLVLDASPEREALYVVLAERALPEAELLGWLREAARGATFPPQPPAPGGARYAVLELPKEVSP